MRWFGRLRRSSQIAHLRRRGRQASFRTMTAYAVAGPGPADVALSVSKAVGPAVVRNLVKRRMRGALDDLPAPSLCARLLLVAKPAAASEPYHRLAEDIAAALDRLGRGPR